MTWDIAVQTTGDYAVALYYTCSFADAGSTIELSFNGSRLQCRARLGPVTHH
jgi:hypothetical protein